MVTITILFIANDRLYREPEVVCTRTNDLGGNFSGSSWQLYDHIRTLASWTENDHMVQRFQDPLSEFAACLDPFTSEYIIGLSSTVSLIGVRVRLP